MPPSSRRREDDGRAVGKRVLGRVLEEVSEDRADPLRVDPGRELARGELDEDARRGLFERCRRRSQEGADVVSAHVQPAAVAEPLELEELRDERLHLGDVGLHPACLAVLGEERERDLHPGKR